ncbi:hypothetical protein HELRODRAFT_188775 [Helobdella robusta]|uniref:Ubiquitin-like domain-containing protein n=1 Tax=Helobdella robusta TaxID=6412 RepID=T1FQC5_HELRO|nr:hypothetical protein HELRODRAFT_188775 [Helobdella robusta]ESO02613.1 hypothetical protein HELRODRAFT_188775 [Helobdella robusta]
MSGNIQLNISIGDQTKILVVSADCTIDHVLEEIQRKFIPTIEANQLEVLHAGTIISYGSERRLVALEITHASSLTVVMGLKGGQFKGPRPDGQYTKRVSFTCDKKIRCIVSLDNDEMHPRAIMPCGHHITSESMVEHCLYEISKKQNRITCPECSKPWDWTTVEQVAKFKDDEKIKIQNSLSENFLMKSRGYFPCPGCKIWCTRTDKSMTIIIVKRILWIAVLPYSLANHKRLI